MRHFCIKPSCKNPYIEDDPDAYYCFECREKNKKMAERIQPKSSSRPENLLEKYDSLPKEGGFVNAKYFL